MTATTVIEPHSGPRLPLHPLEHKQGGPLGHRDKLVSVFTFFLLAFLDSLGFGADFVSHAGSGWADKTITSGEHG